MTGLDKRNLCAFALILSVIMPQAMACTAGSLDLELVSATGTDATAHPLAKCFSSMTVSILADCTLTLAANGQNNFVQALWSADENTYRQVKACPTGVSKDFVSEATATAEAGLASLLATSIYTSGMSASVDTVVASSGVISVTSGTATLKFRASAKSGLVTAGIFSVGAPTCISAPGECAATAIGCDAGHFPVSINGMTTYICALCASGTYSAAGDTSCTNVAAGRALNAVGSGSNTSSPCNPGTFATLGSSDCRPCAPGMYQDEYRKSSCKPCPDNWYSHMYGSRSCVTCTNGRPTFCVGNCGIVDTSPGSGGSFTAIVASDSTWTTASDLNSYSYPDLFKTCSPVNTLLSFTVDATCAIQIRALANTDLVDGLMCSDPSNTASAVEAYYVDPMNIMSLLPADVTDGNILKITNAGGVTMSDIAATRYPSNPTATVAGTITVNGGKLVRAAGPADTCPLGTYRTGTTADDTLSCTPCNPGYACPAASTAGTSTCNAGTYSTMGQETCTTCPLNTYAPDAGSSECTSCSGTVGSGGTTCDGATKDCGAGMEFNPATNVCDCADGYRASGSGACTICPINTYLAGAPTSPTVATCTACPSDKFSAAGSSSVTDCGVCPAGEAKNNATPAVCARCAPGQEPAAGSLSCQACGNGFYNPTDGSGNALYNKCQRCEGGKYTDGSKTTCDGVCAAGYYSTWTSSTVRVPSDPTVCVKCPDGGYSATGAAKCTPCAGGSEKNGAGSGCQKCTAGTFRTPYSSGGCQECPAGTAAKAGSDSCTTCSPGSSSPGGAGAATCDTCVVNTYASDPGSSTCSACAAGTTTLGETGAVECTGCPAGTRLVGTSCVDCGAGFYQDREGQKSCKSCPVGQFTDQEGSTSCDACPAGKYSSSAGSPSCRVCPGGTFSAAGKGSCSICDKGKYSAAGATACIRCAAGYYANKLGSRTCTACPAGSKCPGVGSTGPTLCSAGSFQSKPAQTTCTPCAKKTSAPKARATKCTACANASTVGSSTATNLCNNRRRMLLTHLDNESF